MLQIIGTKKNRDVQKAIRYCKESRVEFQFVDLCERDLSKREWESIFAAVSNAEELIDSTSQYYKKEGYSYRDYDPVEELIMHPELMRLPILRNGNKVSVGFSDSFIKESR